MRVVGVEEQPKPLKLKQGRARRNCVLVVEEPRTQSKNATQGSIQMENLSQGNERYQTLNIALFSTIIVSKER